MATADDILKSLTIPPVRWEKPVIIAVMGLPGTGKSTVAQHLADLYPMIVLSTDALRLKFGFASGPETLEVMHTVIARLMPRKRAIIIDGVYLDRKSRIEHTTTLAEQHDAYYRLIHTIASQTVIDKRLKARIDNPDATKKAEKFVITPEHFARIKSYFEPPAPDEPVLTVNTSKDDDALSDQLEPLAERLYAIHPGV